MRVVSWMGGYVPRHLASCLVVLAVGLISATGSVAAQSAETGGPLFIQADTVIGPTNIPEAEFASSVCVQQSRFARNEEIVWRVKVFDPLTGAALDDAALAGVAVVLPDQTLAMRFGPHPRDEPVDFFWTVSWDIPEDYPTGELPFTVEATGNDGRSGVYEQFGVSLARLTITEEIRPVIEEEAA